MSVGQVVKRAALARAKASLVSPPPRFGFGRVISPELKVVETGTAQYACDTTGSVTCLNLLATGTDFNTRIGRKVALKSVQVRGTVYPVDSATQSGSARVMIVYDDNPNGGSIAAISDILQASEGDAFMNLNNRDRFKVIADFHLPIGRVDSTATQSYAVAPGIHAINCFKKLNHPVIFNNTTTATIGAIQQGALLLVTLGSQGAGLGAQAQLTCRVRFSDS